MNFRTKAEANAVADAFSSYSAYRPVKRVSVAEGAAQSLFIRQPGGYTGNWSADETPYMIEPMNMFASRKHEAVCFVGPARTGKTMGLIDGTMAYAVTCDPGDMLIVQMTQEKAREFSKTRVDRAIRNSPPLQELISKGTHDDNTHDKMFKHGMWLKIGWPTVSQLSSSDYRYVVLTDYDRMPDDVDGEGAPYSLALKRTTTFLSRGMCVVESSPGRPINDPNWTPATPHEAPPCEGVIGIYNRSDRRRLYWPCPHCDEFFEAAPGLGLFGLPDEDRLIEIVREADVDSVARQYGRIICPHCGCLIDKSKKHDMNLAHLWVPDGQRPLANRRLEGDPVRSNIAGYWLGGVAAAYQSWHSLLMRYLQGLREYALTGSELTLQTTVNTDQGMPYLSRLIAASKRASSGPESRKDASLERFIVPDEARFIVAAVDVQGGQNARFVVQVHAIGPHKEQWPIDRYEIRESKREGVDGGFAPIDPATYAEDWGMLTDLVLRATYRTTVEGRELRLKALAVDTGGEGGKKSSGSDDADGGVSANAYEWYRTLRLENMHNNVMLVKGASNKMAPLIRETWVGAKRKGDKGDVPLYLLNPNLFKDNLAGILKRTTPGPAYYHIPEWLPKAWFDELNAEIRNQDGTWTKVRKRNEALDLSYYVLALIMRLGADRPEFWENPPLWAAPLDAGNVLVITREERQRLQSDTPQPMAVIRRRSTRSMYASR